MNNRTIRNHYDAYKRMHVFGQAHQSNFPAAGLGVQKSVALAALLAVDEEDSGK